MSVVRNLDIEENSQGHGIRIYPSPTLRSIKLETIQNSCFLFYTHSFTPRSQAVIRCSEKENHWVVDWYEKWVQDISPSGCTTWKRLKLSVWVQAGNLLVNTKRLWRSGTSEQRIRDHVEFSWWVVDAPSFRHLVKRPSSHAKSFSIC